MYLSEIIIVLSQSYIHSLVNLFRFRLLIKFLKFKYRRLWVLAKKKTGRGDVRWVKSIIINLSN